MGADKKAEFLYYLRVFSIAAPEPQSEYHFHPQRNWRFDYAWPAARVAVEVNGNAWHVKGGGRHGKSADLEKMNAAQALGWVVFQFTPQMLELAPVSCVSMVIGAINERTNNA